MTSSDIQPAISPPRHHAGTSWVVAALGFGLLLGGALALGLLLARFIEGRPLNLREHSVRMANRIAETLEAAGIPASAIQRTAGEARRDEGAVWFDFHFEAKMPDQQDPAFVVQQLEGALTPDAVKMAAGPVEADRRSVTFLLAGREFASLSLLGAPPPPPEPVDLGPLCRDVNEAIRTALMHAGARAEEIHQDAEDVQQDACARWLQSLFHVDVPESTPLAGLPKKLDEALTGLGATLTESAENLFLVTCFDRCVAEIRCVSVASAPPPGPVKYEAPEDRLVPENLPLMEAVQTGNVEQFLVASIPSLEELPLESVEQEEPENGLMASPAPLAAGHVPRIAIILDDGGYGGPSTRVVLNELDPKLTLAILPNTRFGRDTAERAKQKGFEIMLHMPMETHSKTIKPFPGQLNVNMGKEEIQRLTEDAIAQVPGLVGVNNHTGSKFTGDAERMGMFMEVLKKRGLYFIDSRTLGASKGCKTAREHGVPTEQRNIFLDNEKAPAKIQAQLAKLVARAKSRGQAIGIGHFRDHTVGVLVKELPKLHDQNVELVHVSELVR